MMRPNPTPLLAPLALALALGLALPVAAGPLPMDLPRLDWPQGQVAPSTKGCVPTPGQTCPTRG